MTELSDERTSRLNDAAPEMYALVEKFLQTTPTIRPDDAAGLYEFVRDIAAFAGPSAQEAASIARSIILKIDGPDPKPQVWEVEDMLPCKVCGSYRQGVSRIRFWNAPPSYEIKCMDCQMHSASCPSVKECVVSWNELNRQEVSE